MGVPAFFKWLSLCCPEVVQNVKVYMDEEKVNSEEKLPSNYGNPPIDNLYIDMNGIIHPCFHPQSNSGIPPPLCEEDIFNNLFYSLDLLIGIVNPRRLIYMAIDGVAPRAKMNQQRSRRFRAAQEGQQRKAMHAELVKKWEERGLEVPESLKTPPSDYDSNVITPGTPFMDRLAKALQAYVTERMNFSKKWSNLAVIFSDSNVPGEGEHKILDFIRQSKAQPDYNPRTSHCIYGADADLIMLGLSTHEPHFYIIREQVLTDYEMKREKEAKAEEAELEGRSDQRIPFWIPLQFIIIRHCREFIANYFRELKLSLPFAWDLEKLIDDFVMLCFFVGNDFIPHLPGFKIREGGISALLHTYYISLPLMGDYLTSKGNINMPQLAFFVEQLSKIEEPIVTAFINKNIKDEQRRQERDSLGHNGPKTGFIQGPGANNMTVSNGNIPNPQEEEKKDDDEALTSGDKTGVFKAELKKMLATYEESKKKEADGKKPPYCDYGLRQRYYSEKFSICPFEFQELRYHISKAFVESIHWVLLYYYKGCPSWDWYYPYHYSPFVSDLDVRADSKSPVFLKGTPFTPVTQLLAVLPPASSHAVPEILRPLMTAPGTSPIADFYPKDFDVDLKGKRFAWLGEVLLPFIDQTRLVEQINKRRKGFTESEKLRDTLGTALIYVNCAARPKKTMEAKFWSENFGVYGEFTQNASSSFGKKIELKQKDLKLREIDKNQVETLKYQHPNVEVDIPLCFFIYSRVCCGKQDPFPRFIEGSLEEDEIINPGIKPMDMNANIPFMGNMAKGVASRILALDPPDPNFSKKIFDKMKAAMQVMMIEGKKDEKMLLEKQKPLEPNDPRMKTQKGPNEGSDSRKSVTDLEKEIQEDSSLAQSNKKVHGNNT